MGHDIFGYRTKEGGNEIAYLRRSAFNELGREIYKALNATEYDCGCSGCGETVFFPADRLRTAAANIGTSEDLEPERKFLSDCTSMAAKKASGLDSTKPLRPTAITRNAT